MSESEFRERLTAAAHDLNALARLTDELEASKAPWAGPMRIRLAAARLKLRAPKDPITVTVRREAGFAWLAPFGLPQPDGRPLYRYRISQAAFEALREHLRRRAAIMRYQIVESDAALFVIWAAEWFRRVYAGGGEEWARLGAGIGLTCDQARWRALADRGLKFWKIPALRLNRTHHRLVALARQGGFPLAALGDGSGSTKGWAASYLERLVGILLGDRFEDDETALAHARGLSDIIPSTWANDGMIAVSAELAAGIVRLRREAEAAGIGDAALAIAWLDTHHSNWRDELPMAFDDAAAQALLGGLMRTRAIKGGGDAISIRRVLSINSGERREQLELMFDGVLASEDPRALRRLGEEWSRLRLYAAGTLAQYIGGELGVAAASEGDIWTVRPSVSRNRFDVPFSVEAQVELRGDGARVAGPFAIPRGAALRGGLLTLREDADRYVVEGSGSGAFRASEVHIEMPETWRVELCSDTDSVVELGVASERRLLRLSGEARVHAANGDVYLIRTGQTADQRDRLILVGDEPVGLRLIDGGKVFRGPPNILVGNDKILRNAAGEGWWRSASEKGWQKLAGTLPPGQIDFAWRDRETGHIRATANAFVVPPDFRIGKQVAGDTIDLSVSGWPSTVTSSIGLQVVPNRWRVPIIPRDKALPVLALGHPAGPPARVVVALPQRAWIHDWSQGPTARNDKISLAMLHRYVARSDGRCELLADLLDRDGAPVTQGRTSWLVEDELALAAIRDDIAALLRPLGDIRACVRLDFHDGHMNHWYVSEFDHDLRLEHGGYVPSRAIADDGVHVIGRSLSNPAAPPRDFEAYSLFRHRPIQIPPVYGDWLIYLKGDDRVLSCPQFHRGEELANSPSTPLGKAMAVTERIGRLATLRDLCDAIVRAPLQMRSSIREILDLALSLDGLPPSTFDIFSLLAERPLIATLMLFAARESEVETVMRLSEGLPFAWPLAPPSAWKIAAETQAETMFAAMPEAAAMIGEAIGSRRQLIAAFDPTLKPLLGLPTKIEPLREAANSFVTRSHDRIKDGMGNPFRPELEALLPIWAVSEIYWRALDAPVAAGLAAQEKIALSAEQIRCIKDIARMHPTWFAQGFATVFVEEF